MKVNSNVQAMIAGSVLRNSEAKQANSTQKLSSGYRLNNAKDNPAGMAISNRMRAQIQSLNRANQNSSNAVNVIETAEGALSEIQEMVQRISELSIKAANGTNTTEDRTAIQDEINQLTKEITRISNDTEYNTQKLLNGEQGLKGYSDTLGVNVIDYDPDFPLGKDYNVTFDIEIVEDHGVLRKGLKADSVKLKEGTNNSRAKAEVEGTRVTFTNPDGSSLAIKFDLSALNLGTGQTANLDIKGIGGMKIQVGASEGQEISIAIPKISLENLGLDGIDVRTEAGAAKGIDQAKEALSFISSVRSRLGALENRFETTISNLDVAEENLTKSYSTIKDTDMAEEMVEYTTLQVLVQAGTTMLSQANEQPQQALQLLQ